MKTVLFSVILLSFTACGKSSFLSQKFSSQPLNASDANKQSNGDSTTQLPGDVATGSQSGQSVDGAASDGNAVVGSNGSKDNQSAGGPNAPGGSTSPSGSNGPTGVAPSGSSNSGSGSGSSSVQPVVLKKVIGPVRRTDFTQFAGNYCETQQFQELSPTVGQYRIFCMTGISPFNNVVGNIEMNWNSDWLPEFSKVIDIKLETISNTGNAIFKINNIEGGQCPYANCTFNSSIKDKANAGSLSFNLNVQNRCHWGDGTCQSNGNFFAIVTYNY